MRTRFFNLHLPAQGTRTAPAELVVEEGRFVEVSGAEVDTAVSDERWVDLGGALVLPGVVDCHVGFHAPASPDPSGFAAGSLAAAAGGVTCVADMADSLQPPTTSADRLHRRVRQARETGRVDFMLWAWVDGGELEGEEWREQLSRAVDAGAAGVAVTLLTEQRLLQAIPYQRLAEVMRATTRLGVPLAVRAQDEAIVAELTRRVRAGGEDSLTAWAGTRPAAAEVAAVGAALETCRDVGARVHFVDVSCGEAVDLISAARLEGLPVSAATSLPYLAHDLSQPQLHGAPLKTSPPLRTPADRERLWQGLEAGEIDLVSSGHRSPPAPEAAPTGSVWSQPAGRAGIELLLPYLLSEGVGQGRLSLQRLSDACASAPARLLGIQHRKGRLTPGLDADFVVVDPSESWVVGSESLHGQAEPGGLSGTALTGRVRATYVRGRCVYHREADGGVLLAPEGTGVWLRRGTS